MMDSETTNTITEEFDAIKLYADSAKLNTISQAIDSFNTDGAFQNVKLQINNSASGHSVSLNVTIYPDFISGKFKYMSSITDNDGMPTMMSFNELAAVDFVKISDFMDEFNELKARFNMEEGSIENLTNCHRFLSK